MIWWIIAILYLLCGVVGRLITRRLDTNIITFDAYMAAQGQKMNNITEDITAVIIGPFYLLLFGIYLLLRRMLGM